MVAIRDKSLSFISVIFSGYFEINLYAVSEPFIFQDTKRVGFANISRICKGML